MIKSAGDQLDVMLIALISIATALFFAGVAMFMTAPEVKIIQELRLLDAPGAGSVRTRGGSKQNN
ncbi:hypothetical protein [Allohahella marinimesophila]|uniref:Uncharacterized protein n=1 Tax=Allohahella marinimesophila TaxID=1054972 RepID=A0ABP7NVY6_9GAMM